MDCCEFWTWTGLACFVPAVRKGWDWPEAVVGHGMWETFWKGWLLTWAKEAARSWNCQGNSHQLWVTGQEVKPEGKQQEKAWHNRQHLFSKALGTILAMTKKGKQVFLVILMQTARNVTVLLNNFRCVWSWKHNLKGLVWVRKHAFC